MEHDPSRCTGGTTRGPAAQQRHVVLLGAIVFVGKRCGTHRIEFQVARINNHIDAVDFAKLAKFRSGARGLHRPTARQDVKFLQVCGAQRVKRMQRQVGCGEVVGRGGQYPNDIHCDVADADDCGRAL